MKLNWKALSILLVLVLCISSNTKGQQSLVAEKISGRDNKKPNILVIMTDQHSADMLSAAGNRWVYTPSLDKIAASGIRFEKAYVTNPVCMPSRFSIQSGKYPSSVGIRANDTKISEENKTTIQRLYKESLGNTFRSAGYDTYYGGKFHVPMENPNATPWGYQVLTRDDRKDLAKTAVDFLNNRKDNVNPFLFFISFINPHDICFNAIKFGNPESPAAKQTPAELFEALEIPKGISKNDFFNKYCPPLPQNHLPMRGESYTVDSLIRLRDFRKAVRDKWSEEDWRLHRWAYARLTERVDTLIGHVMEALEKSGLSKNTIVVFTADHGEMNGAHKLEHKTVFFEESARIPFIISSPFTKRKGIVDSTHLVSNGLDLLPTLCDMAGIVPPKGLEGRSLKALVESKEIKQWRDHLFIENELGYLVHTGRFKYELDDKNGNKSREVFSDLKTDPGETLNMIKDPQYSSVINKLKNQLLVHIRGVTAPVAEVSKTLSPINVASTHCEYQENPIGIDALQPRLGWTLTHLGNERGLRQTAYQIQVASTLQNLLNNKADMWDSGILDTIQSNNIDYKGKPLQSAKKYYWRVKIWDNNGISSSWSHPGFWEMGLLEKSEWQGKWIGRKRDNTSTKRKYYEDDPAPVFRKEFLVPKKIKKATLYISGLGYHEAYLNGRKVGNKLLDPAWTNYSKRVLYSTYDVTSTVENGNNCVGVMLGNGWYDPLPLKMWGRRNIRESLTTGDPKFIMQLNIEYVDGSKLNIISDEEWKVKSGPIVQNSIYLGEKYDARLEIPNWNKKGFNASSWEQASVMEAPTGNLCAEQIPAIVAGDTIAPLNIKKLSEGKFLVDFGRNFGGIIRLKAQGKVGQIINMKYGELLYPDGSINVMTSTAGQIKRKGVGGEGSPDTAYAKDVFILSGKGTDIFQPHFTFHGFRYVEITGYPGMLNKEHIVGLAMYSDVSPTGTFSCSDTLLNQIQQACLNTFKSNIFSVQSDCPQRERFGYGGDIVATSEAFIYNYDMTRFYEKTALDFADEAQPDGGLTETAPFVGIASDGLGGKSGPVEWGAVLPVLLYQLYQYYGNADLIKDQYQTVKKWVDFMHRNAKNNIITRTIGDHESLDEKLVDLSATAYYFYNTLLLSKFANILHRPEDHAYYDRLKDSIKLSFLEKFANAENGKMGIGTAAAQAYALYFDLIREGTNQKVLEVLLEKIRQNNDHITTGIFGTKLILNVLSETGNGNMAYTMATQKTFPGWGHMIENGATTLWEHWEFSDNTYSHNHPMFGSISEWFYKFLGGIRPEKDGVGFNQIIIQPQMNNMQWANTTYKSILGEIRSHWKNIDGLLTLKVSIPVNASAKLLLPSGLEKIQEGGAAVKEKKEIKFLGVEKNNSILTLGSGNYEFTMPIGKN